MTPVQHIWISPYTLIEEKSLKARQGLLIKALFEAGEEGYGDLHSFPEFLEGELKDYMQILTDKFLFKKKIPPPPPPPRYFYSSKKEMQNRQIRILHQTFLDIYLDAQARAEKKSLLWGYTPIDSHYLLTNCHSYSSLDHLNFKMIKIKIQRVEDSLKIKKLLKNTSKNFRFRLDFNYQLTKKKWQEWERKNQDILPWIDFIEDPFLNCFQVKTRFPLAWDWGEACRSSIRVIKAPRFSIKSVCSQLALGRWDRVIFTHTLRHPLSARLSFVRAAGFYKIHPRKKEVCGLHYPSHFFLKNDFSQEYPSSLFYSPLGTGLGFDELLNKQKWRLLW